MAYMYNRLVICFLLLLLPYVTDGYSRFISAEELDAALDELDRTMGQDLDPRPPARLRLMLNMTLFLVASCLTTSVYLVVERAPQQGNIGHPGVYIWMMLFTASAVIMGLLILLRSV